MDSGYYEDLSLANNTRYNLQIKSLIQNNWVDEYTRSIVITVNLFNINFPIIVTLSILFEVVGDSFKVKSKISLLDLHGSINAITIFMFVFSVFNIIMIVVSLKKRVSKKEKIEFLKIRNDENSKYFMNKEKKCCDAVSHYCVLFKNYVKTNFRHPNFFESTSKNYIL